MSALPDFSWFTGEPKAHAELPGGDQQEFWGAAVFSLISLGRYNLIIVQYA
jgi:hypothetical protein